VQKRDEYIPLFSSITLVKTKYEAAITDLIVHKFVNDEIILTNTNKNMFHLV